MTARIHIMCPVCKKITLLRYQLGFLESHPIRFRCGYCGISIEGKFSNNDITFQNGIKVCDEGKEDYVICSSGELLTDKLKKIDNPMQTIMPSPFINACMIMGNDKYIAFKENIINILKFRDESAYDIQNTNDLYFRNNHKDLLDEQVHKYLPADCFPMKTKVDILRAVHHINVLPFVTWMGDEFSNGSTFISNIFNKLIKSNRVQIDAYSKYICSLNVLDNWEKQIAMMYSQLLCKFNSFIPIIGAKYYNITLDEIESHFAITTVSFEEVQQLYVNLYELISDMLPLVVGIDNILQRSDYAQLKTGHSITKYDKVTKSSVLISNLTDFIAIKEKGKRINYLDGSSDLEKLFFGKLDKDVRNAIGHFSYDNEDVFNQTVRFKHLSNPNKVVEKSLLRFCFEIWDMYLCLFTLSEICYNLKRIDFESQGIKASIIKPMLPYFPTRKSKPGVNQLCPCGSGKKFKKCCRGKGIYD